MTTRQDGSAAFVTSKDSLDEVAIQTAEDFFKQAIDGKILFYTWGPSGSRP